MRRGCPNTLTAGIGIARPGSQNNGHRVGVVVGLHEQFQSVNISNPLLKANHGQIKLFAGIVQKRLDLWKLIGMLKVNHPRFDELATGALLLFLLVA